MTLFFGLIELFSMAVGFGVMMSPETVRFPRWHRMFLSICFICIGISGTERLSEVNSWDYNQWVDPGSVITVTISVMTLMFVGRGLYRRFEVINPPGSVLSPDQINQRKET